MVDSVKNLLLLNLPIYIIIDSQEWLAIIDYDIFISDIVEYEINYNLNNEEYILINNIIERGFQMYRIDEISNKDYYIIYKNDSYFCKVSKSNSIEEVKKYFNIK